MKKILAVDDNNVMRVLIVAFLRKRFPGAEILEAQSGLEAKSKLEECLASSLPNAVFTDFEMPGMNGLELMKFIKKDLILNKLPVVMMSGVGGESGDILSESVKNLGGHFLAKPLISSICSGFVVIIWSSV